MLDLTIQPPDEKKKGRSFQATCVATVTANSLFEEGNSTTIRPIWAMFAGSESSLRPFMANLKLGRKAQPVEGYRHGDSDRYEFLKSISYHTAWQREPEGVLATIFHPELFRLDPGMVDPSGARFVMLVPEDWARRQTLTAEAAVDHVVSQKFPVDPEALRGLLPTAYLFAAYLDRRTRCPLIADGRFYLQLLCGALDAKIATFPGDDVRRSPMYSRGWGHNHHMGFNTKGLEEVSIRHAIAFKANHKDLEEFMAQQVSIFFDRTGDFVPLTQRIDLTSFMEAE